MGLGFLLSCVKLQALQLMARLSRLTVPGYPHHIIQRGNNRQAIFSSTADYQMLLALLDENAQKFGVAWMVKSFEINFMK